MRELEGRGATWSRPHSFRRLSSRSDRRGTARRAFDSIALCDGGIALRDRWERAIGTTAPRRSISAWAGTNCRRWIEAVGDTAAIRRWPIDIVANGRTSLRVVRRRHPQRWGLALGNNATVVGRVVVRWAFLVGGVRTDRQQQADHADQDRGPTHVDENGSGSSRNLPRARTITRTFTGASFGVITPELTNDGVSTVGAAVLANMSGGVGTGTVMPLCSWGKSHNGVVHFACSEVSAPDAVETWPSTT